MQIGTKSVAIIKKKTKYTLIPFYFLIQLKQKSPIKQNHL